MCRTQPGGNRRSCTFFPSTKTFFFWGGGVFFRKNPNLFSCWKPKGSRLFPGIVTHPGPVPNLLPGITPQLLAPFPRPEPPEPPGPRRALSSHKIRRLGMGLSSSGEAKATHALPTPSSQKKKPSGYERQVGRFSLESGSSSGHPRAGQGGVGGPGMTHGGVLAGWGCFSIKNGAFPPKRSFSCRDTLRKSAPNSGICGFSQGLGLCFLDVQGCPQSPQRRGLGSHIPRTDGDRGTALGGSVVSFPGPPWPWGVQGSLWGLC